MSKLARATVTNDEYGAMVTFTLPGGARVRCTASDDTITITSLGETGFVTVAYPDHIIIKENTP